MKAIEEVRLRRGKMVGESTTFAKNRGIWKNAKAKKTRKGEEKEALKL